MTLTTLTLDQIPLLTDEECDALYASMHPRGVGIPSCIIDPIRWEIQNERRQWWAHEATFEERETAVAARIRVCHPDCPASVIEGLPALVERRTGQGVALDMHREQSGMVWATMQEAHGEARSMVYDARLDSARRWTFRHLPHASFAAAFAACVVLGRKG